MQIDILNIPSDSMIAQGYDSVIAVDKLDHSKAVRLWGQWSLANGRRPGADPHLITELEISCNIGSQNDLDKAIELVSLVHPHMKEQIRASAYAEALLKV